MPLERVVNNGQTTVANFFAAGGNTLTVVDASKLPTLSGGDQFHIVVFTPGSPGNAEIMVVTAVSGNVLTVTPAAETIGGIQTAFPHSPGDTVAQELSVDSLLALIRQNATSAIPVRETPAGSIDGSNPTFTLSHSPNDLALCKNGLLNRPGSGNDYLLSGSTITFNPDAIPQPSDTLDATYNY